MVTCFFTFKVISVNEPSGTGTLIPQPPIFPSNSGKILVKALAAPVVVGTIDWEAPLALLKSLWG